VCSSEVCSPEVAGYSPDDFGLAQLDQSALEAVLAQVSFTTAESASESASESAEQEVPR